MSAINKVRVSKSSGNDIFSVEIGLVEGIKTKFSSGNKGYRLFGSTEIDGKLFRITGNLIEM